MSYTPTFASFLWAGFECTTARVSKTERLDMLEVSKHRQYCQSDYQLMKDLGIKTVREGFSWSLIDQGNQHYDFSLYEPIVAKGREQGIQQIWDLNHFDYPDYLDPFSEEFIHSFAHYSLQIIKLLRKYDQRELYIAPINEISFFAWIAADQGKWAPFKQGSTWGFKFKTQLVKAAIAAMSAIWAKDKNVRFIHIDPFMRRVAKTPSSKKARDHVENFNQVIRFEAWDMLAGKTYPEYGGDPRFLDIIGINYYLHNQEWVLSNHKTNTISHRMMGWNDPARISLFELIKPVYDRYQRPVIITETGSFGNHRASWWQRTLKEITVAKKKLPLHGVCIYPTLDRPATVNFLLPHSGIFDFDHESDSTERIPHKASIKHIQNFISSF
jgi:polysaccharide biosynthesis protein PelF